MLSQTPSSKTRKLHVAKKRIRPISKYTEGGVSFNKVISNKSTTVSVRKTPSAGKHKLRGSKNAQDSNDLLKPNAGLDMSREKSANSLVRAHQSHRPGQNSHRFRITGEPGLERPQTLHKEQTTPALFSKQKKKITDYLESIGQKQQSVEHLMSDNLFDAQPSMDQIPETRSIMKNPSRGQLNSKSQMTSNSYLTAHPYIDESKSHEGGALTKSNSHINIRSNTSKEKISTGQQVTIFEKTPAVPSNKDIRKEEPVYFDQVFSNNYRLVSHRQTENMTQTLNEATNPPSFQHNTEVMSLTPSQVKQFRKQGVHYEETKPSDLIYSFSKFSSNISKPLKVKQTVNNDLAFLSGRDEQSTVDLSERVKYETAQPHIPGVKMNTGLMDKFLKSNIHKQIQTRLNSKLTESSYRTQRMSRKEFEDRMTKASMSERDQLLAKSKKSTSEKDDNLIITIQLDTDEKQNVKITDEACQYKMKSPMSDTTTYQRLPSNKPSTSFVKKVQIQEKLLSSDVPKSVVKKRMRYVSKIEPDTKSTTSTFMAPEEKRDKPRLLVQCGKLVETQESQAPKKSSTIKGTLTTQKTLPTDRPSIMKRPSTQGASQRNVKVSTKNTVNISQPSMYGPSTVGGDDYCLGRNTLMQPSVSFSSQGRNPKTVVRENKNLDFFVRKEDKAQCISLLAYREKTLREQGVEIAYEKEFQSYPEVVAREKTAWAKLTSPTAKDPKHFDVVCSPEQKRKNLEKKQQAREEFQVEKQARHQTQRKYRQLKSNWKNGVVGLEQPMDERYSSSHRPSTVFQEQNQKISRLNDQSKETQRQRTAKLREYQGVTPQIDFYNPYSGKNDLKRIIPRHSSTLRTSDKTAVLDMPSTWKAKAPGGFGDKHQHKRDTHSMLFSSKQDNLFGKGNFSGSKEAVEKKDPKHVESRKANIVANQKKGRVFNPINQTTVHFL